MDKKSIEYNEKIKSNQLKIIDVTGEYLGDMSKNEALALAENKELDLVVCAPNAEPPVAKLCHLDKYLFEMNKKEQQIKKKTKQMELKKLKIGVKIDPHDLCNKLEWAKKFIIEGNMVMFFMKFRRKEMPLAEKGIELLKQSADNLKDIASITKDISLEKNTASLTLKPLGKKK